MSLLIRAAEALFTPPWRLILLVAAVAAPLLVGSEFSSLEQREQLRRSEGREVAAVAARTAATFGDRVLVLRNGLVQLSGLQLSVTIGVDRPRTKDLAAGAWQAWGADEVVHLYVLGEDRRVYAVVPQPDSSSPLDFPFPRQDLLVPRGVSRAAPENTRSAITRISAPYPGPNDRVFTMISATRRDSLVLAAEVDLARIAEKIRPQLPAGEIYLADGQGLRLMTLAPAETTSDAADRRRLVTATALVPETDWQIVLAQASSVANDVDPALDQIRVGRLLLVALLLVGAVVVALTGSQLLRQRRLLAETNAELARVSQEKSRFLANMSHELRTPLNAIIGFGDLLQERIAGPLNDKQSEYVRDITESGKHQLALVNDILDLSKVEAGKMEFSPESFDAAAGIDRAQTLIAPLAVQKGIRLIVDHDRAPIVITHDEGRFRQVLYNLLSNAVKFTPDGGSVTTSLRANGDWIEVGVTDTGVGMSAEDQATIFEEFKRVGADYARAQTGTGLGLALVQRFVEEMGGEISVTSEVGKGSTFHVRLPRHMPRPSVGDAGFEPATSAM